MNRTWAQAWLDAFDHTTEKVVSLYADDFTFEDVILQQRITDKQQLHTFFTNFANTNPALGVHTFTANSYTGTAERNDSVELEGAACRRLHGLSCRRPRNRNAWYDAARLS